MTCYLRCPRADSRSYRIYEHGASDSELRKEGMGFDPLAASYIAAYLLFSGLLPLCNKAIFTIFPFPVTATVIQIFTVAAMLLLMTVASSSSMSDRYGSIWTKLRLLLLPSMFFAGNITLTNLGTWITAPEPPPC